MDPYHNTFDPQQPAEEDFGEDHLRVLERELAPQATDYYGILNVSKTATEEELKESYKKLCRFFHPDKHNNPESKKLAEAKFQVIQKAYEVLSDPAKRAIYDTYGAEGLNATWEIGTRYKTPEELREEYEKQARIKREQQLENLVRSRAEFQVNLDASPVFDPYEPPIIPAFAARQPPKSARRNIFQPLTRLQVQQLFMRHSFETQVGPQTRVILGGSMLSRNGIGGGNLSGTLRHTVSPKFWTEFTATMLKPHTASLKTYYNISSDTFVNTVSTMRTLERPPVINVTIGRRLYATTTGYMTYRTGEWSLGEWGGDVSRSIDRSAVALGFATARKQGNYSVELQTGIIASHIALEYTHKLLNRILLRLSAVASTTGGLTASVGSDHKITEHSRFGMSIECGVPSGVAVKFKVSRLGQKVVLPIVLSTEFDVKMAFFGAIVPVSIALALDQLILKPRRRKQIKEKIEQLREEHAEYLATRKQEALDGQKLMREVAERKKRQEEKKKDGLVVVKALYGRATDIQQLSGDDDEQLPEGVIDVTVVIQALVNESRVTIPGGYSKTNILGFYDPCLGEKKQLKVQYRFQHRLHEVTVSDTSPLICPMRSHIA